MSLLVGVDVGGTKTHIKVVMGGRVLANHVGPSTGWSAVPVDRAANWLAERVRRVVMLAVGDIAMSPDTIVVGAHGCEDQPHCDELAGALAARLETDCVVVNDAQLLVPAAGLDDGIGLVAGTGAVAVGRRASDGTWMTAGGWGWVLGDDGSASSLVREAARAAVRLADVGRPDGPLEAHLLASFEVPDLVRLAHRMSWDGGVETWGEHAHAVFAAADDGSAAALTVLDAGAAGLARVVRALVERGAAGSSVVAAGGVVTSQPRYHAALEAALAEQVPGLRLVLLGCPPVDGAVELAREHERSPSQGRSVPA